jgi:hypothetical protein
MLSTHILRRCLESGDEQMLRVVIDAKSQQRLLYLYHEQK